MSDKQWEVVSGSDVQLDEHYVLCVNLEDGTKQECEIRGHWLYVQKCERAEEVGGILLPERSRKDTVFALVLAVGTGCGTFRKLNKTQKKMPDMRSSVVLGVKPGDKVMCPDDHTWGIKRSPWREGDFFVDECVIAAVVPAEE